ncbi:hypothetical protein BDY17DRAFT_294927 [Neohortaea acidophila]|uniref:Uncharacterized protein n=1 Tax=Neohortaea acidophila TaxID=245834 RepID=A0A6A6PX61_9PEZI|nr:uncharacterized protein BDY17DRAFT_294927 [Neohortaea acidophila]KAF2484073.1 hypothetical protein BDY17DRAFT_294927 [Neohortaea acidophila]
MHFLNILAPLLALAATATAAPAERIFKRVGCTCNAAFTAVCENGATEAPLNVESGVCTYACTQPRGGIKKIYGETDGDNCHRLTAYGTSNCEQPTYSSTTTECNRGQPGLTSGNAQWYGFIADCACE